MGGNKRDNNDGFTEIKPDHIHCDVCNGFLAYNREENIFFCIHCGKVFPVTIPINKTRGRPSKLDAKDTQVMENLASLPVKKSLIAEAFGVARSTVWNHLEGKKND
jgi:hypothetical protein